MGDLRNARGPWAHVCLKFALFLVPPCAGVLAAAGTGRAQDASAAAGLFQARCARCHGADGRGGDGRSGLPDFTDGAWHRQRADAQLVVSILEGKDRMPAFDGRISERQARDLVAFIRQFGPAPARAPRPTPGDFEQRFEQLEKEMQELKRQMHELQTVLAKSKRPRGSS